MKAPGNTKAVKKEAKKQHKKVLRSLTDLYGTGTPF